MDEVQYFVVRVTSRRPGTTKHVVHGSLLGEGHLGSDRGIQVEEARSPEARQLLWDWFWDTGENDPDA